MRSLCLYLNPGLSHIIETRKVLDLRIDLKPSYLLLPKSGFYDGKSDLMIVDFGYLQVREGSKNIIKRELFLLIMSVCLCVRMCS